MNVALIVFTEKIHYNIFHIWEIVCNSLKFLTAQKNSINFSLYAIFVYIFFPVLFEVTNNNKDDEMKTAGNLEISSHFHK